MFFRLVLCNTDDDDDDDDGVDDAKEFLVRMVDMA